MASMRELSKFMFYWYLTYAVGLLLFLYYCVCQLVGKYGPESVERVRRLQPSCLTDIVYGTHKYFKLAGMRLHYVEKSGKEIDPSKLVILIHETPGFWFGWRNQIPALAKHYRVIAVDLRGCGDSDSTSDAGFTKEQIVQDIVYLIKTSGCSSVNLVCNETSGYIGWEIAEKFPHMISKLVFVNSPHPNVIHQLFHLKPFYYLKYWYLLFLQIPSMPEMLISNDHSKRWLQSMIDPQVKAKSISEQEIEAYRYSFSRRDDWKGVIKHLRQIEIRPWRSRSNSPAIVIPTLMIFGSNHPHIPVESAYRSAELVEKIRIKVVEGGSSHLQLTHVKQVNEELLNFLTEKKSNYHQRAPVKTDPKSSLVGRVFEAVTYPYNRSVPDVASISNGIKEAAKSTGVNLSQTIWSKNYDN